MIPGELWRHRGTGRIVRIEVRRSGFLSFSVWTAVQDEQGNWGGRFVMHSVIWDEVQFRQSFEQILPGEDVLN